MLLRDVLSDHVIEEMMEYIETIEDMVHRFSDAMKLLNNFRISEARSKFKETADIQDRVEAIKKNLLNRIEEMRLEATFKEDIFHLIKRLDAVSDWVKEASRELTIIPYLDVPQDVRRGIDRLINIVVNAVKSTVTAIKHVLNNEIDKARELIDLVNELEEKADMIDVENRGLLLKLHDQFKPLTLAILIHDLNRDLEEAVDACRDVADYLRLIISRWIKR